MDRLARSARGLPEHRSVNAATGGGPSATTPVTWPKAISTRSSGRRSEAEC